MISFTPTYSTFPPTHSHTHPSPSPISSFTPNNKKPCITMFYLSFCKRNVLRAGSRDVNHPPSMILPEKAHRKQGSEEGRDTWKPTPVSPFSRFKLAHGLATELTAVRGPIVLSFPIWVVRFLLGLADLVQVPLEFITWKQKYPAVSKWRLWRTMTKKKKKEKKTRRKLYGWSVSEVGVCFKWKYDGSVKLNANVLKCFNEPFSSVFLFFFYSFLRVSQFFFFPARGETRYLTKREW